MQRLLTLVYKDENFKEKHTGPGLLSMVILLIIGTATYSDRFGICRQTLVQEQTAVRSVFFTAVYSLIEPLTLLKKVFHYHSEMRLSRRQACGVWESDRWDAHSAED